MQAASGSLLIQGLLTCDAELLIGEELHAVAEAEFAIEMADAVKGAAILDALLFVEDVSSTRAEIAATVTTAIAAEVLHTLILAGFIEDEEIEPALPALVQDNLPDVELVRRALAAADAADLEVREVVAAQSSQSGDV